MVKSEHGSPTANPSSNLEQLNGMLPPLDLSLLPGDYSLQSLDGFSSIPDDQPLFSAGLSSASIDWSHYDGLDFNGDNFATSSYSQAPSFSGWDFSSIDQPALTTTSTSGEISEVEEFAAVGDSTANRPGLLQRQYGSDFDASDFGGDIDGFRLSTASSFIGLPQTQMLASTTLDAIDMDTFLKGLPTSTGYVGTNHGLPNTNYLDGGKLADTRYDELGAFPPLSNQEEAFWLSGFASNNNSIDPSVGDPFENNVWAQQ